jgi:hypothetical protein
LTNDELESTVLDPPSVELLKDGNGEFVDKTAAGVFVGVGNELPVLLCIANLFAVPRSRLRNKRNKVRMKDRMDSIVELTRGQSKQVKERRNDKYSGMIV